MELVYRYDGSFPGLLTCVFHSIADKQLPAAILPPDSDETFLYPERQITTDEAKARRVAVSIPKRISDEAWELTWRGYLTCHPQKELLVVNFLRMGYSMGAKVVNNLQNDTVSALSKAVYHLNHEAHLLTGFARFSIHEGAMTAVVAPKNLVLPLIGPHFKARYPNENFMIYDKTHEMAYFYHQGKAAIQPIEALTLPPASAEEMRFRQMWKGYYDAIAIEGRINPRCRMGHMPKRYWAYLTELNPDYTLPAAPQPIQTALANQLSLQD